MVRSTKIDSASIDLQLKRKKFRRLLLENLDRRYLMANDAAGPVFAPGTSQAYVDFWIDKLGGGATGGNQANLQGSRWVNPVGGPSPNIGDPAVVTWSIVPDGTPIPDGVGGGGNQGSDLVAFLDGIYGGGTGPVANRPWFPIIERAYQRWSDISGLNLVYEPSDDGAPSDSSNRGVLGVRGDIRIAGRRADGNFGILAYNYYPNGGGNDGLDGDMVIDTADAFYSANAESPSGENRAFFNVLMHEAGHGIGLGHVIPVSETKLMEPFASTAFLGAQHDDILGVQTLYGDNSERDDTLGTARDLGTLQNGLFTFTGNSIDFNNDTDFMSFNVTSTGKLSIEVRPVGFTYNVGPQGGTAAQTNSLIYKNLSFVLMNESGTVLQTVDAGAPGVTEQLVDFDLPAAGRYNLQIRGVGTDTQLYDLAIRLAGTSTNNQDQRAPHLLSVAANSGENFGLNRINTLSQSPRELTFRFDGSQVIDANTFSGIKITRAGGDGVFGNASDQIVTPAYIGYGENERIVVARFASPLPDDIYRIEVLATDLPGESRRGIRNSDGALMRPRRAGTDRDTFFMNLELGAQVVAVVPQPVTRNASGVLTQARSRIEVYFNDDDLHPTAVTTVVGTNPTVVDPAFYKLILTRDTVNPNDDVEFSPSTITYDPALDRAVLTFPQDIDLLAGGAGTFRLRVGSNEQVATLANPSNPLTLDLTASDVPGTLDGANDLGPLNGAFSAVITQEIRMPAGAALPDYPGSTFEPGKRDIDTLDGNPQDPVVDQTSLDPLSPTDPLDASRDQDPLTLADNSSDIKVWRYSFALGRTYGLDTAGRPLTTVISSDQMARVREIFDFYGAQLGVDFEETTGIADFTIVVGDMAPNNKQSGIGADLGVTVGGLTIMDQSEAWDNSLGNGANVPGTQSFFLAAMHQIGHLLGLGHAYEQPAGTIMGGFELSTDANLRVPEWFFPGNIDLNHGRYIYRPDNKDVDIYRFMIPAGSRGQISLETVAERMNDASSVDTHLTLMKKVGNSFEVVALNDNYFSEDSFIRAQVEGGVGGTEYFVAVTARGNGDFNPLVTGTGSGATSAGRYQLRMNFRPSTASQIVDTSGTAIDGDGDGLAGGNFNFWFRAASPFGVGAATSPKTFFVDKDYNGAQPSTGATNRPFTTITQAIAAVNTRIGQGIEGDIIRVVGTRGLDGNATTLGDNPAYEIGDGGTGKGILGDGKSLDVPKSATLMIDAGAIFKLRKSGILAGSLDASSDRSGGSLQVLGTPTTPVFFTSHFDESIGIDTNILPTEPKPGDWGGLEFRLDSDRSQGRLDRERQGVFLNYVGFADMQFGGGQVGEGSQSRVVNAISMSETRPTLLYNTLRRNADAGMAADPNSFEETTFSEPRYHITGEFFGDYDRVGPVIRGNTFNNNSFNGLQIRIDTLVGAQLKPLSVAGRIDDRDVTYLLGEALVVQGQAGGNVFETVRPLVDVVELNTSTGGSLTAGDTHNYVMTFVDRFGGESLSSLPTRNVVVGAGRAVALTKLPAATGDFVGRRLWRSQAGGIGPYVLVAELNRDQTTFRDVGNQIGGSLDPLAAATKSRARLDASLVIDPGIVLKSFGGRIEVGIGATLIAEGTSVDPIIFTSRLDDRFGAGGTFDTNNDGSSTAPSGGNWSGIVARHLSTISLDAALVTFAGGNSSVPGSFASFNALELHQATARVSNTVFEQNASGATNPGSSFRAARGPNDASVIYVVGSQPILVNNIIRNNNAIGTAAISIDANSLNATPQTDYGRSTGANQRVNFGLGNRGPLIQQNRLSSNGINGLRVRGGTLTTESIWDDTDIVHVLQSNITVPNFTTYGGLLLKSNVNESLVVKLQGPTAGFTAAGLPLDIPDRIGGSLQILGSPGFPVYLTSLFDDTIGAGFDIAGNSQVDTDGTGLTTGSPGAWGGILLDATSNDRNVDTNFEREADKIQDRALNDIPSNAQDIGSLASTLNGGDENLRLGVTVHGTIASSSDLDVYRFTGTAGTMVWIDIDRTSGSLDTVVELIDENGIILALSDNSFEESPTQSVFSDPTNLELRALVMDSNPFAYRNVFQPGAQIDFQGVNPLDAGLRLVLPGVAGSPNSYYVRVRSSSRGPTDPFSKLIDPAQLNSGITTGSYRMQLRLQQTDEIGGSTVRYADVRFAQNGIRLIGLPGHSPLLGESSERPDSPANPNETSTNAVNVGNVANSDRAEISIAGSLLNRTDVDWYRFSVHRDAVQQSNSSLISTVLDIDYADGGRADNTLWVYRETPLGLQLILVGTDSSIADDQPAPLLGSNEGDLSRGSFGARDPFIGASELPDGDYFVAVTNSSFADTQLNQFTSANAANPNIRFEPINGFNSRKDRFDGAPGVIFGNPTTTRSFGDNNSAVPFNLSDVTLYVGQNLLGGNGAGTGPGKLWYGNAKTGGTEADVSGVNRFENLEDFAVLRDGRMIGFEFRSASGNPPITDANSGNFVLIDSNDTGDNVVGTTPTNSGLETWEGIPGNPPTVQRSAGGVGVGMRFRALSGVTEVAEDALFGVASRADGSATFQSVIVNPDGSIAGLGPQLSARNILYRIDPDSLEAISPPLAGDYTGPNTAGSTHIGGGTQIRPYGRFNAVGNVTGLTEVVTWDDLDPDTDSPVTALFAVTNLGEVLRMPIGDPNVGNWTTGQVIGTILDPAGAPVNFTGLTAGPRNLQRIDEDGDGRFDIGRYENTIFGVTATGELYAINIRGTGAALDPVFPFGQTRIQLDSALASTATGNQISGIDFSQFDTNLWSVTGARSADAGHGVQATFDGAVPADSPGGGSLYFGLGDNYNVPGGTAGAIESNTIDLRGYTADDQPMLYFNYFMDTEARNTTSTDAIFMRDSLRVYGSLPDGTWILLATNNNSDDGNYLNGNQEFDNLQTPFGPVPLTNYNDSFGKTYKPQQLFDSSEPGYTGLWRQARISLAPFAGLDDVRLRFEFSTQGDARSGDPRRGGVELTAVDPTTLIDGDTFTLADLTGNDFTYEFDMGLVLNLPSGASISNGSTITVEGIQFTFVTTPTGAPNEIPYAINMTPAQIAATVRNSLEIAGFGVFTNSQATNILNVQLGVSSGGLHDVGATLDPNIIIGRPGVSIGSIPVSVNQEYPVGGAAAAKAGVRDAMRVSLAASLNAPTQTTNVSVWDFYGNTIQLYNLNVVDGGKLGGVFAPRRGDSFEDDGLDRRDERAQNNDFEGVYIDDIMIGFAERGEMIHDYTVGAEPGVAANSLLAAGGLPFNFQLQESFRVQPVETGAYQLNVRTAADFGISNGPDSLVLAPPARSVDTNVRLANQMAIVVDSPSGIIDGQTFTLSDGYSTATFEFDVVTSFGDVANGTEQGRIPILINPSFNVNQLATAIRDAINSEAAQKILKITASSVDANPDWAGSEARVQLHGSAAQNVFGDLTLAPTLSFERHGVDTPFGEDLGDSNRLRDQGQVVISSTVFRDSAGFGIVVDASPRDRRDLSPNTGPRQYPGSPRNLVVLNNSAVAPGVVIVNNIVANNRGGGILVSGDTVAGEPIAPATIARVINNTVFGFNGTGNGIRVEQGASPTLLNNILANNSAGISVDGLSGTTVVGGSLYRGNGSNSLGVSFENAPIFLTATDPLFVSETNGRFIPAAGSQAIDSSIASLEERPALSDVKNGVKLPVSPMVAPSRDIGGILRVDDPEVDTPQGVGQNVFIDRGAVDRADDRGPVAVLLNPLDNDTDLLDVDRNITYVRLLQGNLNYFSVLLNETQGTGPDSETVTPESVMLTENGRLLIPGVDYVFAYSVNGREIRLTPFSGFWRRDSVYEITLNNRPSFRFDADNGSQVVDGQSFTVQPSDGSTVTLEYESGFVLSVPQTFTLVIPPTGAGIGGILDGQQFRIQNGLLDVDFEFDTDGDVPLGTRAVPIPPVASATEVRDAILAVLTSPANADLNLAPKAVGADRISLGTLSVHRVIITSAAMNLEGGSNGIEDGQQFVVTPLGKPPVTFEFNLTGDTNITPGNLPITLLRSDNYDDIATKIADALRPIFTGGFAPVSAIQGGVVHVGGKVGDLIDVSASRLSVSGQPGVTPALTWTIPSAGGAAIADGAQFSIRIGSVSRLFEFTKDLPTTPGTRPISIQNTDTATVIATKVANAIRNAGLGLANATSNANVVRLNEPLGTVVNLLTSGINSAGVPGGAVAVPFIPSVEFNRTMLAGQVTRSINGIGLGVRALMVGDFSVLVDGLQAFNSTKAVRVSAIADYAGNLLERNRSSERTQFTIVMPEVVLDYGDAPGASSQTLQVNNGARHALLPEDEARLVLGAFADSDPDGAPSVDANGDDYDTQFTGNMPFTIGTRGPALLNMPTPSPALVGRSIVITDSTSRSTTFEFTNGSPVTIPGAFAVNLAGATTSTEVATRFMTAVRNALLAGRVYDLVPVANGSRVSLGGTSTHSVDLTNAGAVSRVTSGRIDLSIRTNMASYSDGQLFNITDGNGNAVVFELQDATSVTPVPLNRVPVVISLSTATPATLAQALASAIQSQIDARNLAMPNVEVVGSTLTFNTDDEDGVLFDGPFNGRALPVPMIVTSSGTGMIDAWFDWNQDGDFGDAGERSVSSYPVRAGQNTIFVQTPANAAIGFTMARIRLSAGGGLQSDGIGLGGEVEDYMIEVLDGTPPVGRQDEYSVNEDNILTRTAAQGVLSNDSDPDGDAISVFDLNPLVATVQVVTNPEHGTLVMNADGSFTYDSNQDYFGPDSFVYTVTDGRLRSLPTTVLLTVNPVNDAPTADNDSISILEDETVNLPGSTFWSDDSRGPLNESGQTLTLVAARIITPRGGNEAVSVSNDRLTYVPPRHYNNNINGPVLLELTIRDGGVAGGDANPLESRSTLTINIGALNDAPIFTLPSTNISVFEDNESVVGTPTTSIAGFANPVLKGPVEATDEAAAQTVTFEIVNVSNPSLFTTLPSISDTGVLSFVTAKDQNGSTTVVVQLRDSGLSAPAGNFNLSARQTFTINVTAVNDAPEFNVPTSITSVEDQTLVQVVNFATGMVPAPATATDEVTQTFSVTVAAANPAQFSLQPTIGADGTLLYRTAQDVNGPLVVTAFLTDSGLSTPFPNVNRSEVKTFTINVVPVNDAPTFNIPNRQITLNEDNEDFLGIPRSTFNGFATNLRMGPDTAVDEVTQTPTFLIANSAPELFSEQPAISSTGVLTFKTAPNKNGRATLVVRLQDSGPGGPAPNTNLSVPQTVTITISPINDAPLFTIPATATAEEDQGLVTIPTFATNILRGPAGADDESSQEVNFVLTAVDPTAFEVQPAIAPDGTLTFKTANNVNSNTGLNLRVRARLLDNGDASPAPNSNQSVERTFTLTINPVNDQPIPDSFTTSVNEDGSLVINATSVLAGDTPGPADESSQTLRIIQTERSSDNGGSITPVFNANNEIISFSYTPGVNKAGVDFFRYVIADNGTPSRSATGTITINVNAVNDPPQFTPGIAEVVGLEDVAQTGLNWASSILPGPPNATDEITGPAAQTVTFQLTVDRPALFSVAPTIDGSGVLRYVPAKDASGSAVITVVAVDSGSNVAPNNGRSAPATFTITMSPVNDAPVFTSGGNVTVDEDSGARSAAWATQIRAAQGLLDSPATANDESSQTVSFEVTNNNPALFAVQPTVLANGNLQFTPAPDAFGVAVVSVVARDSGSGNAPNINTSAAQTFTITISASNDAPTGTPDSYDSSEDALLSIAAPGLLSNDSDIDFPNDQIRLVDGSTTSLLGVPVSMAADGSFTYDPRQVAVAQRLKDGETLTDSFTYRVEDLLGSKSNVITVFINLQGNNDAPVAVNDRFTVTPGSTTLLAVLNNDTDVDSLVDARTIQIGQLPLNGTVRVLQTGRVEYVARAGFRGQDTFTYTVRDVEGTRSQEATVTVSTNVAPVAVNDVASTARGVPVTINVLRNDSDSDGTLDPSTVQISVPSANGTTVVNTDGTVVFTPNNGYSGTTTFAYAVADNEGIFSNVANVTVRVSESIYQNPKNRLDVNDDGFISPIDALLIINDLNLRQARPLPPTAFTPPPFIDVTGDSIVSPTDSLQVLNYLNSNGTGSAEGEFSWAEGEGSGVDLVLMVTPQQMIDTVAPLVLQEVRQAIMDSVLSLSSEEQGEVAMVPAIGSYRNGRLSESDRSQESLEDVVDSLSWYDNTNKKKQHEALFSDLDEWM